MRTTGTIQDVYKEAKGYYFGDCSDRPMNPEIHLYVDGEWSLTSGLIPYSDDVRFVVDLETFDTWFYEGYKDAEYIPNDEDEEQFIKDLEEWSRNW